MLSKDAAEIQRQIDEECAKEQDELNEQLNANIQAELYDIDRISLTVSDQETTNLAYGANRFKVDKKGPKKKEDFEEPSPSQQLLGEKQ